MKFKQITVIGLGLIGGSLAAVCRRKFPKARIVGISRNRRALAKAKKKKWIHEGTTDLRRGLASADLVIVCTPVDTLKDFLQRIDRSTSPGTIVTDTGSVKGFLVRWADRQRWQNIHFVGAHPMAGSHEQGIDHADPHLFDHALTFVVPPNQGGLSSQSAVRSVTSFWKKISHRIVVISSEEHDRLTAQVSHLPHLLTALLVISSSSKALDFAASGFLDTTRIVEGGPSLWVPIFLENRKELHRLLENFVKGLVQIKKILKNRDRKRLKLLLTQAQRRRAILD